MIMWFARKEVCLVVFFNPADKTTETGENITSLARVIKNEHEICYLADAVS